MFKGHRGLVLRTTRPMKVNGQSIATGTRVKYMAAVDKNSLKVKVQDKTYPKLRGEHATIAYSAVAKVDRGRPTESKPVKKAAPKKTVKRPASKAVPAATPPASAAAPSA